MPTYDPDITYCSAPGWVFGTMTGDSVTPGLVKFQAFEIKGPQHVRYNEEMTKEEAYQLGIDCGALVAFRDTDSFLNLCKSTLKFHGEERAVEKIRREKLDVEAFMEKVRND